MVRTLAIGMAMAMVVAMMTGCGGGSGEGAPETAPAVDDGGIANDAGPAHTEEDGGTDAPVLVAPPDSGLVVVEGGLCAPHCADGATCGTGVDVCTGGTIECGVCSGYDSCGGAGKRGVCGCTPAACKAGKVQGACGVVPDNCGATEDCGACDVTAMCEQNSCLTFQSLGCVAVANQTACLQGAAPGEPCVVLAGATAATTAFYVCPSASALPADLCTSVDGTTWMDCRPLPR